MDWRLDVLDRLDMRTLLLFLQIVIQEIVRKVLLVVWLLRRGTGLYRIEGLKEIRLFMEQPLITRLYLVLCEKHRPDVVAKALLVPDEALNLDASLEKKRYSLDSALILTELGVLLHPILHHGELCHQRIGHRLQQW